MRPLAQPPLRPAPALPTCAAALCTDKSGSLAPPPRLRVAHPPPRPATPAPSSPQLFGDFKPTGPGGAVALTDFLRFFGKAAKALTNPKFDKLVVDLMS